MKSPPVLLRNSTVQIPVPTRECRPPLSIANGDIITNPPYKPGSFIAYACSAGFFMTGSPSLRCSTMFTWIGSPPQCDPLRLSPRLFNHKSEIPQVPLWLLVTFSCLFAIFTITSILFLLCHCCISKRFCLSAESRSKVRHSQLSLRGCQNSNDQQKVQVKPEEPGKQTDLKNNKIEPSVQQKKMSAATSNKQSNTYSLRNYGDILNETMVAQSCIIDSLPVIYAIPIQPNPVKTVNRSSSNKTLPTKWNCDASKKFQLVTPTTNQETYLLGSRPNEPIYVQSGSCTYLDQEAAQQFDQTSNKETVKQQSAFSETCRGQKRNLQAVKPMRNWLPHTHPMRNINTSTK